MDKHIFTFDTLEMSNWLHTRAARTQAVARCVSIDVQREETEGAVVTVMPTTRWRPDKATTVLAFEYLITGLSDERFLVSFMMDTMRLLFIVSIVPVASIVFVVVLFIQTRIVLRCLAYIVRLAGRKCVRLIAVVRLVLLV